MLGHSIAPHCHNGHDDENSVCDVEHLESVSLLHFIGSFFHADPGGNHLEEFQLPGFDSFIGSQQFSMFVETPYKPEFPLLAEILPYGKCLAPADLRGPPVEM
jgi:hypothetical protein